MNSSSRRFAFLFVVIATFMASVDATLNFPTPSPTHRMYKFAGRLYTEPEFLALILGISFGSFLVVSCISYYLYTIDYLVYLLERERWERERSERQQNQNVMNAVHGNL
jgi:hypothetical protein